MTNKTTYYPEFDHDDAFSTYPTIDLAVDCHALGLVCLTDKQFDGLRNGAKKSVQEDVQIIHYRPMIVTESDDIPDQAKILIEDYVENLDQDYRWEDRKCIDEKNPMLVSAAQHFLSVLFHLYKATYYEPNGDSTNVRITYCLKNGSLLYSWQRIPNHDQGHEPELNYSCRAGKRGSND